MCHRKIRVGSCGHKEGQKNIIQCEKRKGTAIFCAELEKVPYEYTKRPCSRRCREAKAQILGWKCCKCMATGPWQNTQGLLHCQNINQCGHEFCWKCTIMGLVSAP